MRIIIEAVDTGELMQTVMDLSMIYDVTVEHDPALGDHELAVQARRREP